MDPAGLPFIQPPGRPGLAGGAAGAIYKWLGILQDRAFPPDVVECISHHPCLSLVFVRQYLFICLSLREVKCRNARFFLISCSVFLFIR